MPSYLVPNLAPQGVMGDWQKIGADLNKVIERNGQAIE